MFETIGGRKFAASVLVIILSALLVIFGMVGETNYTTIVLGVIGIYVSGNVAQKTFSKTKEGELNDVSNNNNAELSKENTD